MKKIPVLSEDAQKAYKMAVKECADTWARHLLYPQTALGNHGFDVDIVRPYKTPGPVMKSVKAALLRDGYVKHEQSAYSDRWLATNKAYIEAARILSCPVEPEPSLSEFDQTRYGLDVFKLSASEIAWILAHRDDWDFVGIYQYSADSKNPKEMPAIARDGGYYSGERRNLYVRSKEFLKKRDAQDYEARVRQMCDANLAWGFEVVCGFDEETAKRALSAGSSGFRHLNTTLDTFDIVKAGADAEHELETVTKEVNAIKRLAKWVETHGGWQVFKEKYRARIEAAIKKEKKGGNHGDK